VSIQDILRSRLALRIYLVGLAQFAVVAAGFAALIIAHRATGPGRTDDHARFAVGYVVRALGDPRALTLELQRIREDLHASVTVVDAAGAVVATNALTDAPVCADTNPGETSAARSPRDARCVRTAVTFPDGSAGRVDFTMLMPPPPRSFGTRIVPLVLVVVGVSSWLLARTLTRPLRRLSATARSFGHGDLTARVGAHGRDELGDVARAFDEMAERVTALRRAEKELLANVSHELRTPLARTRVALDLALEGDAGVARELLPDIAGDLDELERLITDILTAARLDLGDGSASSGIPPLRRAPVIVADLLAHAASRFRSAHPDRTLDVDVPADLPAPFGDAVLLRRVVDNLLENAHRYSDRADPIALSARSNEVLEIEVIDRGVGIAAEDLPRVFRPFFRADRSRARATGGLGLGLALAKRIIDAHGGDITLESAPNEGTRARIRLPVADEPAVEAP
jgi:two-component system, OmpR family, sensor kinase